ncbi:outer membrane protein [Paradevosia shaoguanensis]|uniref:outer membrane protein n=1 Tax=Paradevosia shaoguanensis TaxID=1335043 RepID=UPI00193370E8|nr:outer membrane beta-barrel protein [Paradevosia shaoguanensis]
MRTITLIAAALVCLGVGQTPAAELDQWSGFYAGVIANGAVGQMVVEGGGSTAERGATLSAIAGYRAPIGEFVGGIEAALSLGDVGFLLEGSFYNTSFYSHEYRSRPAVSFTGSIGIPLDDMLPFAFAGVSVGPGSIDSRYWYVNKPVNQLPLADMYADAMHVGLTAGVGIDARLTEHILLRGQYTFLRMLPSDYRNFATLSSNIHMLGAGLIYRF